MGFGEDADRPTLVAGLDYRQRFGFRGVEHGDGFLDVHGGMQHDVAVMQDAGQTSRRLEIRPWASATNTSPT